MRSQIWPQVSIALIHAILSQSRSKNADSVCGGSGCGGSGRRSLPLLGLFLILLVLALLVLALFVLALFVLLILGLGLCGFGGSRRSLLDLERSSCKVRSIISTVFEFNVALDFIRVTSSQAGTQIGSIRQWKSYEKCTQAGRGQLVNPSTTEVW